MTPPAPILPRLGDVLTPGPPQWQTSLARTTRVRGAGGRFTSLVSALGRRCTRCGAAHTVQWRTGRNGQSLCNKCGMKVRREVIASSSGSRRRLVQRNLQRYPLPSIGTLLGSTFSTATAHENDRLPSIQELTLPMSQSKGYQRDV